MIAVGLVISWHLLRFFYIITVSAKIDTLLFPFFDSFVILAFSAVCFGCRWFNFPLEKGYNNNKRAPTVFYNTVYKVEHSTLWYLSQIFVTWVQLLQWNKQQWLNGLNGWFSVNFFTICNLTLQVLWPNHNLQISSQLFHHCKCKERNTWLWHNDVLGMCHMVDREYCAM